MQGTRDPDWKDPVFTMNHNLLLLDISPFRLRILWSCNTRHWETAAIVVTTGVLAAASLWLFSERIGNQRLPSEEDSHQGHSSPPDEHRD